MKDGEKIVFSGESTQVSVNYFTSSDLFSYIFSSVTQQPGYETGDVVVFLEEEEHATFKRKDTDLYIEMV